MTTADKTAKTSKAATPSKPSKPGKATKNNDDQIQNGMSEEQKQREINKAANTALKLQREAKELIMAAAGAGDPKERQRLLNEALQKEVEAGSFGKTAKYLSSGTFQGVAAGGGIGVFSGVSVGVLTGSIVGGVTSVTLGGLGAALGAGVGWLHGPWFKLGDMAGNAITKVTGTENLGWKATDDQKKALEKMIGQVNEQDIPMSDELHSLSGAGKDAYSGAPELDTSTADDQMTVKNQKSTLRDYVPGMKYVMADPNAAVPSKPKPPPKEQEHKESSANELSKRLNGGGANATNGSPQRSDKRRAGAPNGDSQPKEGDSALKQRKKPRKLQSKSQKPGTADGASSKGQPAKPASGPPKPTAKS